MNIEQINKYTQYVNETEAELSRLRNELDQSNQSLSEANIQLGRLNYITTQMELEKNDLEFHLSRTENLLADSDNKLKVIKKSLQLLDLARSKSQSDCDILVESFISKIREIVTVSRIDNIDPVIKYLSEAKSRVSNSSELSPKLSSSCNQSSNPNMIVKASELENLIDRVMAKRKNGE